MNVIFKLSVFYGSIVAFNFDQIIGEKIVHELGQISNIVTAQCVILQISMFSQNANFAKSIIYCMIFNTYQVKPNAVIL